MGPSIGFSLFTGRKNALFKALAMPFQCLLNPADIRQIASNTDNHIPFLANSRPPHSFSFVALTITTPPLISPSTFSLPYLSPTLPFFPVTPEQARVQGLKTNADYNGPRCPPDAGMTDIVNSESILKILNFIRSQLHEPSPSVTSFLQSLVPSP